MVDSSIRFEVVPTKSIALLTMIQLGSATCVLALKVGRDSFSGQNKPDWLFLHSWQIEWYESYLAKPKPLYYQWNGQKNTLDKNQL